MNNNPDIKPKTRICPKCGQSRFTTTAHVMQEWLVDGDGNFINCIDDCMEVTVGPDKDNIWICDNCGAEYHE